MLRQFNEYVLCKWNDYHSRNRNCPYSQHDMHPASTIKTRHKLNALLVGAAQCGDTAWEPSSVVSLKFFLVLVSISDHSNQTEITSMTHPLLFDAL